MDTNIIGNTSLKEILDMLSEGINQFLEKHSIVYELIPLLVIILGLYYLLRSIYVKRKRDVESNIFIVYCIVIIIIAAGALYSSHFGVSGGIGRVITLVSYVVFVSLPGIFCFHTWSQVEYKRIKVTTFILYFFIPVVLVGLMAYRIFSGAYTGDVWSFLVFRPFNAQSALFLVYWLVIVIKSLLLCFNVFYQMPKHMRGSTMLLIMARAVLAAVIIFSIFSNSKSTFLVFLLALIFSMNRCFSGFFRAKAANVIATSREFVFSNLSTMILILSNKGRILEWNRNDENVVLSLIKPKYLQPMDDYRQSLLEIGQGTVSPHDENVITIMKDDVEYHLLISNRPIKEGDKQFGNLIEIAEITGVYSVLRYMESIAARDHMTGLFNRNAYMMMVGTMLAKDKMPLLIIVGDVNNLKSTNDTKGHLVGDRLLTSIAEIVMRAVPPNSFVARIGGDEIVVLVPCAEDGCMEAFSKEVEEASNSIFDEDFGHPSISLGWAVLNDRDGDYNAAFKEADEMMYTNKKMYKANQPLTLSGSLPELPEE
jgi:diguanylate cyclase (GGDEF)-like protein